MVVKEAVPKMNTQMAPKNSFKEVRKLFSLNDKNPLKDFEKFSRIMVDHSNLEKDGEISKKWLEKNVVTKKVWNEMIFECNCNTKVSSLIGYLDHQKSHKSSLKLKCPEHCKEIFSSLSPFINHIVSAHQYEYLCYCCICCGKIFYNIPALINHYELNHPNIQNLFMCVECGSYCQNLVSLKSHKNLHYPLDLDLNNTVDPKPEMLTSVTENNRNFLLETDISFAVTTKQRRAHRSNNNKTLPETDAVAAKSYTNLNKTMRNYHCKTQLFDDTMIRKTYPCLVEGCPRILVTKSGYEYHMMVHNGVKPFQCDYCNNAFRSKQLKNLHMRCHHENN